MCGARAARLIIFENSQGQCAGPATFARTFVPQPVQGYTWKTYSVAERPGRRRALGDWEDGPRQSDVKRPGGWSQTTLATFSYDAVNRRIVEDLGTARDLYYSAAWQVLEERVDGEARVQYVWSPVYVDALVVRDRDADENGTFEERLYVLQDANFNVTALVDTTGTVVERYVYEPYGAFVVLTASWGSRSASLYGAVYQWQGLRFEIEVGLYYVRFRDTSPTLMRPVQQDPT